MKKITNAADAACLSCFVGDHAVINKTGQVVCENCGSMNLTSRTKPGTFEAEFGGPAKTYKASVYTPECRDRRTRNRPWPAYKEQRARG